MSRIKNVDYIFVASTVLYVGVFSQVSTAVQILCTDIGMRSKGGFLLCEFMH